MDQVTHDQASPNKKKNQKEKNNKKKNKKNNINKKQKKQGNSTVCTYQTFWISVCDLFGFV